MPAPTDLVAEPGTGHVRLNWDEGKGAAGYVIERSHGGWHTHILSHGGSDVPAIATCAFADTGLADGVEYTYRVGAVAGAEFPAWNWSEPVPGQPRTGSASPVSVCVDAATVTGALHRVWHMVGSERLTQLCLGDDGHGHDIGAEFEEALRRAHDDLGVTYVRAHAILHDDNGVVTRADDGTLTFDFTKIDEQYDRILAFDIRPRCAPTTFSTPNRLECRRRSTARGNSISNFRCPASSGSDCRPVRRSRMRQCHE